MLKISETCISQSLGKLRKRANSRSKGKQATTKKSYIKHQTMFFCCCGLADTGHSKFELTA